MQTFSLDLCKAEISSYLKKKRDGLGVFFVFDCAGFVV
ncbi:hypothetical protein X559_2127 [Paenilisteria newyorkensis]|nr:hypothetical protein X559_2127 [Listeria newyorkensis]